MAEDVKIVNDSKTCLSRNRVIKRVGGGGGGGGKRMPIY